MLDPVEMRARVASKPNEAAEVANSFNDRLGGELTKRGFNVVSTAGSGVARVRVALTDINESTWWLLGQKYIAAARELRDRYLEQMNGGLMLPAGWGRVSTT